MRVVFDHKMVAPAQPGSPSAAKPSAVMAAWRARWPDLEILAPRAVTREELYRAHDQRYVDGVLDLRLQNGFGSRSAEVNASLFYTSGAMLTAARWAMEEGGAVAAPASGFHHAYWGGGGGFCTFNGLMVAVLALQADYPGLRVGILDYDYHYGNGTDDIIEHLGLPDIVHISAGRAWRHPTQADAFLQNIPRDVAAMRDCDVVMYQAGADAHVEDPLGGFLTTDQLVARDRAVFEGLRALGLPVVWNLAGGYQRPFELVLIIHTNTMRALADEESRSPSACCRKPSINFKGR